MAEPKDLYVLSKLLGPAGGFNGLVVCGAITNTVSKEERYNHHFAVRAPTCTYLARERYSGESCGEEYVCKTKV